MFLLILTLIASQKPMRDTTFITTGNDTLWITGDKIWNSTGTITVNYANVDDSLATPKVKADIIVPKDSTDVDIENLITKDFNDGIVFADKFLSGSMTGGIQEAYDYGVAQGYNRFTIYGATDSSHMNAGVNITTNVALELANSTLLMPEDQYIRWLQGNAAGDSVIVDSCDGFQEGWGIAVWDTTGYDAYHVNHMIVDSVDSVKDIIFFTENLDYAVTTAKGAVACHTFNMFQVSVDEGEIFLMRDGKIDGNSENYDGQNAENKSGWISTLISIDAYSGNDDSTGTAIISNCDFKNVPCNGIGIQGEGSIVENCKFDSCGNYAVDIGDNSVIVTNNTFKYCLTAGVFFCTNMWHCRVTENEFKDCATGITGIGVGSDVRDPAKDEYHLLAGNSFLNTGNEAITLGSYSRGIIISENTIENANRDGNNKPAIQAYNCRNVLIENNFITDKDTASTTYINCGILAHRPTGAVSVIGNQIMNWVGDDGEDVGIKVLGDSTQPVNVTQNAIHGTFQYGIYVTGPSVIGGNIIHDDSTDGFIGIEVRDNYGYDDLTLTNNNIRGFDIPINFSAKPANYLFQDTDSIVHSENIITKGLFRLSAGALISVDSFITNWGDTVTSFHTGDMVCDTTGGDTIKAYLNSAWEVK